MKNKISFHGISTLVNHVAEGEDPLGAHVAPIYQTSTFRFPDVATGAARFKGQDEGYIYTRLSNPNSDMLAEKYASLEGWDLLKASPNTPINEIVTGRIFSSGMAAISTAILARVKSDDTIISHESLYGATHTFFNDWAPRYGIKVVWTRGVKPEDWEEAFARAPQARLVYVETPANPTMTIIDLQMVADIAKAHNCWLMVDNTFATPYCQRPFNFCADVIVHSTTKYLSGHGVVIGGAVVSRHADYMRKDLPDTMKLLGGSPSPFDAWLANLGLKTFELRMRAHCENALAAARYLEKHPKISRVFYPGLESHPDHALAKKQMSNFGGMVAFELKGGLKAGENLMNSVKLITLAVSLGTTDSLIMHPASMSHVGVPAEIRRATGLSDGLVRLSVGIENREDILDDLEQALKAS
jgi:methionine-gamma-lyase